jgi:hypothetical protein
MFIGTFLLNLGSGIGGVGAVLLVTRFSAGGLARSPPTSPVCPSCLALRHRKVATSLSKGDCSRRIRPPDASAYLHPAIAVAAKQKLLTLPSKTAGMQSTRRERLRTSFGRPKIRLVIEPCD